MKPLSVLTLSLFSTFYLLQAEESKIAMHGTEKVQNTKIYYGKILEIKVAMGYKYLKVDENGTELWIAIANAPVALGEKIGYDKNTMMQDFKSKSLQQTFKTIYFASDVYLAKKASKPTSMKEMLGLTTKKKDPHSAIRKNIPNEAKNQPPTKPFVEKESYTIEEIYMWRKNLKDQTIRIKATVFKVSHAIMKRDWIHLGDGSGEEKALTNDLVFTTPSSTLKTGDKVIAKGTVKVNKDFGYGYFYKVIIENASFEVL